MPRTVLWVDGIIPATRKLGIVEHLKGVRSFS